MEQSISIAPLVVFRIAFGLLMLFSSVRYVFMGWVENQLVEPVLHFSYYSFAWVKPLSLEGMYIVFGVLIISSICISIGYFYRLATILFFLCFSYVELIDITYYLNHYYFVSIVAFLMIFVPANKYFSLDVSYRNVSVSTVASRWTIDIFKLQIAIVYIYAGLAKLNYDWLFNALPLSIWLPAKSSLPIIGFIFDYSITPYVFSWVGMLFDTFIIFGLLYKKTRLVSYIAVIIFHLLTGILFQIGVFPLVMIFGVLIFFSEKFHQKLLNSISKVLTKSKLDFSKTSTLVLKKSLFPKYLLIGFFTFQILFPWRFLLYPGNLFWTEQGYRFSWRVMLMEKAGTATFFVKDGDDGREGSVINSKFLNLHQEKQMAMQPDLILQFAHFLRDYYNNNGLKDARVRAEVLVTLNGKPAQLLVDPTIDLTTKKDTWTHKDWILPLKNE